MHACVCVVYVSASASVFLCVWVGEGWTGGYGHVRVCSVHSVSAGGWLNGCGHVYIHTHIWLCVRMKLSSNQHHQSLESTVFQSTIPYY